MTFKHYNKKNKFKKYVAESKGILDISLQDARKYLSSGIKRQKFLNTDLLVEQKTSGVKLNLLKIADTGRAEEDWIMAYDNNIIYPNENKFLSLAVIRKASTNNSQFALVWDHLIKIGKNNIPVNTELFVDFLINKPDSKYSELHSIILIASSKSTHIVKPGILTTKPSSYNTTFRDEYAKEMHFNVPVLLFKGVLGNRKEFANGILNQNLKDLYRASNINWEDNDDIISNLFNMFLNVKSIYGDVKDGVVISYKDKSGTILKLEELQYSSSKQTKSLIESKKDLEYRELIQENANQIVETIKVKDIELAMKLLSDKLHDMTVENSIKEDIHTVAKKLIIKKMPGNNGALIISKARIISEEYNNMIKNALANYDTVTFAIISNRDTKGTKQLRNNILSESFPELEIINSSSNNINTLIKKSVNNINVIISNKSYNVEDDLKIESYKEQLKSIPGIDLEVFETNSSKKILENINDKDFYIANTPNFMHHFYDDILQSYKDA